MNKHLIRGIDSTVVITDDGRPARHLGALLAFAGEVEPGWLPDYEVDAEDVETAIARIDLAVREHGAWVGWDWFGQLVVAPLTGGSDAPTLCDYESGETIGPASPAQIAAGQAQIAKGDYTGAFLVDSDGDVIPDGSWDAQQDGVRSVWVSE